MEVISIDGTEYVRAAVVAKKHKYTADYIGQLCRSQKIDAKLVGRTWYVNPESLGGHKNARYQKTSQNEKTIKSTVNIKKSRLAVEAAPRGDTRKMVLSSRQNDPKFLRRIGWKPVKYEADESELLPPLRQESESSRVVVDMAEAVPLEVTSSIRPIVLEAESLPEISLRGKIKISDIDENFSVDDNNEENIDISDISNRETAVQLHPKSRDRKTIVKIITDDEPISRATEEKDLNKVSDSAYTYDVPVSVSNQGSFVPQAIQRRVISSELSLGDEPQKSSVAMNVTMLTLIGCALIIGGAIVSLEKITTASAGEQVSSLHFSLPEIFLK